MPRCHPSVGPRQLLMVAEYQQPGAWASDMLVFHDWHVLSVLVCTNSGLAFTKIPYLTWDWTVIPSLANLTTLKVAIVLVAHGHIWKLYVSMCNVIRMKILQPQANVFTNTFKKILAVKMFAVKKVFICQELVQTADSGFITEWFKAKIYVCSDV